MHSESSVSKFNQVVRGRNLIILAVAEVVLFLVANIAYGAGHQHGLRDIVSNVAWVLFLVGCILLIALAVTVVVPISREAREATGPNALAPNMPLDTVVVIVPFQRVVLPLPLRSAADHLGRGSVNNTGVRRSLWAQSGWCSAPSFAAGGAPG